MLVCTGACFPDADPPTSPSRAEASIPSDGDMELIREHLRAARETLPRMPESGQPALREVIARAEDALSRYEELVHQGRWHRRGKDLFYFAGAVTLADDASVIGTIDDIFLPFIFLGVLAVHLATEAPAPPPALTQAWDQVIGSLEEVGRTVSVEALPRGRRMPPMRDCVAHLVLCLGTRLGAPGSGRSPNHSLCADCLEICHGSGKWPERSHDDRDCRWWLHE